MISNVEKFCKRNKFGFNGGLIKTLRNNLFKAFF